MHLSRESLRLTLAALALCAFGSANAALVNFTLTGYVDDWADSGNAFGVGLGDPIYASGTFDDSVLSSGSGTVSFGTGSGNSMAITVGSQTFSAADDVNFATGFPQLSLLSGAFDGLNFYADFGSAGYFASTGGFFDGLDDGYLLIAGAWDAASFSVSAVPVPAAAWLFASGLAGLIGFARRSRRA